MPEKPDQGAAELADSVDQAATRTLAGGSARVFYAWSTGAPTPESMDRRGEGVADLAQRRAHVSQVLFPAGMREQAGQATEGETTECGMPAELDAMLTNDQEMIYDGANAYLHVGEAWTGFFLTEPAGPRQANDPLWPLDALAGASGDIVELGQEPVREVATRHVRVRVDLAAADAALPAGVSVPGGPYRWLRALPAEVWLDTEGRARRIAVESSPTAAAPEQPAHQVWAVCELWDFGLPVTITPPGPDELVDPRNAPWHDAQS
jgi:hypothetical protein